MSVSVVVAAAAVTEEENSFKSFLTSWEREREKKLTCVHLRAIKSAMKKST